jgi:hypothetical protein
LISLLMAESVSKRLGVEKEKMKKPIYLSDYKGCNAGKVTYQIKIDLEVNHQRFKDQVF